MVIIHFNPTTTISPPPPPTQSAAMSSSSIHHPPPSSTTDQPLTNNNLSSIDLQQPTADHHHHQPPPGAHSIRPPLQSIHHHHPSTTSFSTRNKASLSISTHHTITKSRPSPHPHHHHYHHHQLTHAHHPPVHLTSPSSSSSSGSSASASSSSPSSISSSAPAFQSTDPSSSPSSSCIINHPNPPPSQDSKLITPSDHSRIISSNPPPQAPHPQDQPTKHQLSSSSAHHDPSNSLPTQSVTPQNPSSPDALKAPPNLPIQPPINENHQNTYTHDTPNQSTSSVGPNVAGRIGVGGNVMVDPYNGTNLSHKGTVGAGAFVYKVYNMLLDPSFQHLISFNPNGQSFTVSNVQDFSKTVLPKHFKHNNFSSFVRQLNMYGFHKVNKTPRGQRGNDNSAAWEFVHPKFHRGQPQLLEQIRRKTLDSDPSAHPLRRDHPLIIHSQSSPSAQRFPLDSISYLSNVPPHPTPFQVLHQTGTPGPFFPHFPQRSKSYHPADLPPAAHTTHFNVTDITSAPFPSSSTLFEGGPSSAIAPGLDKSFNKRLSSKNYSTSFAHPPISADPSASNERSTPLSPSSVAPPSASSMNIDPKAFAFNPIEIVSEMKHEMSHRITGIHASYEALYQELHETRRRQGILIDLVEQMHKTLQSLPNANVGYEFPVRELNWRVGEETTPTFKITEHDYPKQSPMVFEDGYLQQQQAHSSVSVGTSPSVSEFSHAAQMSPCVGGSRSLSVGSGGFVGFGNLSLGSYPNSPVGFITNDQQQAHGNSYRPRSPPGNSMMISTNRSVPLQLQPKSGSGMDEESDSQSLLLIPSLGCTNHSSNLQLALNNPPVSPRATLSTALKTPLPPSPAPFQDVQNGGPLNVTAPIGMANGPESHSDYQQTIDHLIQAHHSSLSITGLNELPHSVEAGSRTAPEASTTAMRGNKAFDGTIGDRCLSNPIVKNEDFNVPATGNGIAGPDSQCSSHNFGHAVMNSNHRPISSSSSSNPLHPSTSDVTLANLISNHSVHHSHSSSHSSIHHTCHKGRKRPASGSMDLSAGIYQHPPNTYHPFNHHTGIE